MNSCNLEFLKRNGINPDELSRNVDCQIHSPRSINRIVDENHFSKPSNRELEMVSVADILGYEQWRE